MVEQCLVQLEKKRDVWWSMNTSRNDDDGTHNSSMSSLRRSSNAAGDDEDEEETARLNRYTSGANAIKLQYGLESVGGYTGRLENRRSRYVLLHWSTSAQQWILFVYSHFALLFLCIGDRFNAD
jgi:hypothetical protein